MTLPGVTVRPLAAGDSLADLTAMLHRAYRPLAEMGLRYLATHQDEETTRRRATRGECFVAERDGRIVGTVTFEDAGVTRGCPYYDRPGVSSLHQLGIEPAFQGCGIGTLLLAHAESRARETGALELALDTAEPAAHLIEYYQRRGYRVVSDAAWGPMVNYRSVIMALELVTGSMITVRAGASRDLAPVAAIRARALHNGAFQNGALPGGNGAAAGDRNDAPDAIGEGSWLVAESGGEVIGFASARDDELGSLVVDPAQRGRGAGRLLLRRALEGMGSCAKAHLPEHDVRARRLYEREGFAAIDVVGSSKMVRLERRRFDPSMALEEYDRLRAEPQRWLGALKELAASHGFRDGDVCVLEAGTNLIAVLGTAMILKVFPPCLAEQFAAERAALQHLSGRPLPLAFPAILAEGSRDGWPYLILSRVDGETLEDAWPRFSEADRLRVLRQVGEAIRALQAVPAGPLTTLEPEWNAFIAAQADRAVARHRKMGLASHLLTDVPRYLAATADAVPGVTHPVILTGEFTPENLLVTSTDAGWVLSGMVDFADCMTGHPEYDLLGPGVFLCEGMPERLGALLAGYGVDSPGMTPALARRLTRLLVLHRYSNLPVQVRIPGWQSKVHDFDEVEALLWPRTT